jgi:hypothetical protein
MPVASANPTCLELDYGRMLMRTWIGNILDAYGTLKTTEDSRTHGRGLRSQFVGLVGQYTCLDWTASFSDRMGIVDPNGDLADCPLDNPL